MDSSDVYDDEVIADSEDEGNDLMLPIANPKAQALLQVKIPPEITQYTTLPAFDTSRNKSMSTSSISGRTSSSSGSKPRPKPRPRYRKDNADATSSSNVTPPLNSTSYPDISKDMDFSASNIADRAKTRTRNKSQANESTALTSEVIELSSDGDDDFSLIPAPKARRKVADKAKALRKSKPAFDDADTPDSKPRPRPRPVGKPKQGKSSDPTSPFAGAISQETNPIPPSSMLNDQFPIPFKLLPSQLPPSDPPTSTAATYDHPPIVTLPQLDTDQEPHSSPSSLFSVDASVGKQKRKRDMSNVDELDSDQGSGIANRIDAETRRMPPPPPPGPPPTFFAGSSSPPLELGRPIASTSTDIEVPSKKRPAAKKSRKKKAVTTDDEDGAWGTSKPKAKSRSKKAPAKKVEVVIERPKAKGKGKEKENGVFKSREFIDDDEDDRMMDHDVDISIFEKPDSLTSLSSIPDSDLEAARKAEPSKKRKSVDRGLPEYDPSGGDGDPPEPKRRAVTQSKGRKLVVSDDEDDDVQNAAKPATYNKTPAQASGKAKGKEKSTKSNKIPKATNADSEVEDSLGPSKQPDEEGSPSTTYKENIQPSAESSISAPFISKTPAKPEQLFPSLSSRYTIAPKTKSTPMSDLIRRVNSKPGSPFCSPAPRGPGSAARSSTPSTAYSPYVKASRSALSRIAPLHPNRRTPPPPLPPPPPKKKTKKELEREEQWEEELVESVGGITEWACMSDVERKEMRRAKREREMHGWED